MTHKSESDTFDVQWAALERRVDSLEMTLARLFAVLAVQSGSRRTAVAKALGEIPLDDREGFALTQYRKMLGDKQV